MNTPNTDANSSTTSSRALRDWVKEVAALTKPDTIIWCDGSEAEKNRLTKQAVAAGILIELNQEKRPGCYLHRSNPNDVARTEQLTFVCTPNKIDAGPTNNWSEPVETYDKLRGWLDGSMRGRTMYVVPYVMGPARVAAVEGWGRADGQPLRRAEHANHDADGESGARATWRV